MRGEITCEMIAAVRQDVRPHALSHGLCNKTPINVEPLTSSTASGDVANITFFSPNLMSGLIWRGEGIVQTGNLYTVPSLRN